TSSLTEPSPMPVPLSLRGDPAATPTTEPDPLLTVDRPLVIDSRPGEVQHVRVTLRGDCAGSMTALGAEGTPDPATATGCIDVDHDRVPAVAAKEAPDKPSVQGSFPPGDPCDDAAAATGDVVCVPGGAFVLGGPAAAGLGELSSTPARIARLPRF